MDSFWIGVKFTGKIIRLKVERLPDLHGMERWKVIASNGEMLLSNNRPILIKNRLKHRIHKPVWKVERWPLRYRSLTDEIINQIALRIEGK